MSIGSAISLYAKSPETIVPHNESDMNGWTALHHASARCNLDELRRLLISPNVDINARTTVFAHSTTANSTALHVAVRLSYLAVVRLLVDSGIDIDARDANGETALYIATSYGFASVVEFLAFMGAEVCAQESRTGFSPLHIAVGPMSEVLCAFPSINLELLDNEGFTPLMRQHQRHGRIRLLLNLNCDVSKADRLSQYRLTVITDHLKISNAEREETRLKTLKIIRSEVGARLSQTAHARIVKVCIALAPLDLPQYVLLWIVDFLPNFYELVSHHKKLQWIVSVRDSVWKMRGITQEFL